MQLTRECQRLSDPEIWAACSASVLQSILLVSKAKGAGVLHDDVVLRVGHVLFGAERAGSVLGYLSSLPDSCGNKSSAIQTSQDAHRAIIIHVMS